MRILKQLLGALVQETVRFVGMVLVDSFVVRDIMFQQTMVFDLLVEICVQTFGIHRRKFLQQTVPFRKESLKVMVLHSTSIKVLNVVYHLRFGTSVVVIEQDIQKFSSSGSASLSVETLLLVEDELLAEGGNALAPKERFCQFRIESFETSSRYNELLDCHALLLSPHYPPQS